MYGLSLEPEFLYICVYMHIHTDLMLYLFIYKQFYQVLQNYFSEKLPYYTFLPTIHKHVSSPSFLPTFSASGYKVESHHCNLYFSGC